MEPDMELVDALRERFSKEEHERGGGHMPDWWFVVGSDFECAANHTHWMPLPAPPIKEES